jgi:hypothetical protein
MGTRELREAFLAGARHVYWRYGVSSSTAADEMAALQAYPRPTVTRPRHIQTGPLFFEVRNGAMYINAVENGYDSEGGWISDRSCVIHPDGSIYVNPRGYSEDVDILAVVELALNPTETVEVDD